MPATDIMGRDRSRRRPRARSAIATSMERGVHGWMRDNGAREIGYFFSPRNCIRAIRSAA